MEGLHENPNPPPDNCLHVCFCRGGPEQERQSRNRRPDNLADRLHPDAAFDDTKAGIGGRVTYNFNRTIAAEAEINFFPQRQLIFESGGSSVQAQFGVKAGKRFEKFGLFAKVRPGFISAGDVFRFVPGSFASKVRIHSWVQSVQGAVATWSTMGVKNRS